MLKKKPSNAILKRLHIKLHRVKINFLCPCSIQPTTRRSFCHSQIPKRYQVPSSFFSSLLLHLCFLRLCSLLDFPDGDLAVTARRATKDIAILHRAERLDTVRMGLQLLWHSVGLWIHHQHLTSQLTFTLTSDTALATTTHPDLRGAEDSWWLKVVSYAIYFMSSRKWHVTQHYSFKYT